MSRVAALAVSLFRPAPAPAPAPVVAPTPEAPIRAVAAGLVLLAEDGEGARPLPFGTPFHEAMFTLMGLVGHDVHVSFPSEGRAGPLVTVAVPGRIDLIFEKDRFAGWFLMPGDRVTTGDGIAVGTSRADLEDGRTTWLDDSGFGAEFERGGIFGTLTGDGLEVDFLCAGLACIFR